MKIITLQCPNCAAMLDINADLKSAVCNYCGKQFIVQEEIQDNPLKMGYEFERGRIAAQNEGADPKLIEAVGALIDPVCNMDQLKQRMNDSSAKLHSMYKQREKITPEAKKNHPLILGGIIAGLFLLTSFKELILQGTAGISFFLSGLFSTALFGLIGYFGYKKYLENKEKTLDSSIENERRTVSEMEQRIAMANDALQRYDINIIPPRYRNREEMTFIHQTLLQKRAVSIQQAVNLLEEEKYRRVLQKQHEEQMELERKRVEAIERTAELEERRVDLEERKHENAEKAVAAVATAAVAGGVVIAGKVVHSAIKKIL